MLFKAEAELLKTIETSGFGWMPFFEKILPSLKAKYLPAKLSLSFICAVKFFSLRRCWNDGCLIAVSFKIKKRPKSNMENVQFPNVAELLKILSTRNNLIFISKSQPPPNISIISSALMNSLFLYLSCVAN